MTDHLTPDEEVIMLSLKSCPKCKGDRYLENDVGEPKKLTEWVCIQCGKRQPYYELPDWLTKEREVVEVY